MDFVSDNPVPCIAAPEMSSGPDEAPRTDVPWKSTSRRRPGKTEAVEVVELEWC